MANVFLGRMESAIGCLALLLFIQGCRGPRPAPVAHEVRASLGVVGVYSVGPTPDPSTPGPADVRREKLKGAAKDGAIGFGSGLAGGALTGAGIGLACGPWAVICSPIFAATGGVIGGATGLLLGGTVGAVRSGPKPAAMETARAAVSAALMGRDVQADMRRRIVEIRRYEGAEVLDLGGDGALGPGTSADVLAGARVVLQVGVVRAALSGGGGSDPELVLALGAQARLIRLPENEVLWTADELTYHSSKAKLSQWTAGDSRLVRLEIDRGVDALAHQIASAFASRDDVAHGGRYYWQTPTQDPEQHAGNVGPQEAPAAPQQMPL